MNRDQNEKKIWMCVCVYTNMTTLICQRFRRSPLMETDWCVSLACTIWQDILLSLGLLMFISSGLLDQLASITCDIC